MGSCGTPPKSNINVKRLHGGGFVVPYDVQSLLREGSHTTCFSVFCVMDIVPSLAGAVGAYYAPKAFKGGLELMDNGVSWGMDRLCQLNDKFCTVGALSRKEKKEVARLQAAGLVVPQNRMTRQMASPAVTRLAGGGVQAHIAGTRKLSQRPPRFRSVRGGKTVVSHTEFVSTAVAISAGFKTQGPFVVNPTIFGTFPWLSSIALNFDKYRFTSLVFEYVPILPTTQAGRVGLIFDYDSQDSAPLVRADCYSYQHSVEGPVWDRLLLKVKTDNVVRYTDFGSTTDTKLIDLGALFIFTDATGGNLTTGDVLIHYTVELIEPQPNPVGLLERWVDHSGVGVGSVGPVGAKLAIVTGTFTNITINFVTPGVFLVALGLDGGTIGGTVNFVTTGLVAGTSSEAVSAAAATAWIVVLVPSSGLSLGLNGWSSSAPANQELFVSRIGSNDFF